MKVLKLHVSLVGIFAAITGCSSVKDMTLSPGSRTDFVAGRIYQLKRPVFLYKIDSADPKELTKLAKLGFSGTPSGLAEFRAQTSQNTHVRGLMMSGEQVQITKFVEDSSPTLGTFFLVFGILASGEHKCTLVELNLISKEGRPTSQAFVDPEYLAPLR